MQPVASVLVIEHRRCTFCGATFQTPASKPHLLMADQNSSFGTHVVKRAMDAPLGLPRTTCVINTTVPHCQHCWAEDLPIEKAREIRPEGIVPKGFRMHDVTPTEAVTAVKKKMKELIQGSIEELLV